METNICVNSIEKINNRVVYRFEYSDDLKEYFNPGEEFFIEYDLSKLLLEHTLIDVPDSILVIPFLCNVLPIAWLTNAVIHVKEIDKQFYDSIPQFKNGYVKMYAKYPAVRFNGGLIAESVIDNTDRRQNTISKELLFFSGGLDAFNSLVNHRKEKPTFMTLWGADVFFDDTEGWHNMQEHIQKIAESFNTDYVFIKSNFRKFLNEGALQKFADPIPYGCWWHEFQHGIGVIGHAAPIAYLCNAKTVYFASTYTKKSSGKVPLASDPSIDGRVKFLNCNVIHDGYEYTRLDKTRNVCGFSKKHTIPITLRVCWQLNARGKNCECCCKCCRAIVEIIAEGYDPNDFGFHYDAGKADEIKRRVETEFLFTPEQIMLWTDVKKQFRKNLKKLRHRQELNWIITYDFACKDKMIKQKLTVKRLVKYLLPYGIVRYIQKRKYT